jgi:hypothetical protein
VLFLVGGCALGANVLANKLGGETYWQQHGWPLAAGLVSAGALSWLIGRRINKPARKDANPRRPWTHDLFFVRMEWWAFPLALAAVWVVATGWKPGDSARSVKAAAQQSTRLAPGAK